MVFQGRQVASPETRLGQQAQILARARPTIFEATDTQSRQQDHQYGWTGRSTMDVMMTRAPTEWPEGLNVAVVAEGTGE